MSVFDGYVGLPWLDKGRGPAAYDCYGLVRAVLEAGAGIVLPSLVEGYSSATDRAATDRMLAAESDDWVRIARGAERAFDGAVLRLGGTLHVGVIIERGLMLHVRRGALSAIEPLGAFTGRIDLYRHTKLIQHRGRQ